MVLAALQLCDRDELTYTDRHETRISHGIDDFWRAGLSDNLASITGSMALRLLGVRDHPPDVMSTAGFPMLSRDRPSLPALLPPTMMIRLSGEALLDVSGVEEIEVFLLVSGEVANFHLEILLSPPKREVFGDISFSLDRQGWTWADNGSHCRKKISECMPTLLGRTSGWGGNSTDRLTPSSPPFQIYNSTQVQRTLLCLTEMVSELYPAIQ
jgi:hypothetical protein